MTADELLATLIAKEIQLEPWKEHCEHTTPQVPLAHRG